MKNLILFSILSVLLLAACQNSKKPQVIDNPENRPDKIAKEYKTNSGKIFVIHIDKSKGESINDVKIETKEFSASNDKYNLGAIDPVEKVFLADLDENGFEEIYLITRNAGSGSYSTIYGIASNNDKSATPIYIRPISENEMKKGGLFEGFMGHNKFYIRGNKLINSFPVYLNGDTNSQPKGGERKVVYKLVAGEAGWILEANSVIEE